MPISFKCPHCKKSLKVKDELAGKKGACPACKKALMIPVPVDYEALAAAALSEAPQTKVEEQQQEPTKVSRTIDFNCPYCDAELHLSAELGGKKEPCPECKRIIKVPMLVQERAKDWRTVQQKTGPSGAAANAQQPQLEGVWDTTQKARVSTEALEEADAIIEEDEEPVGILGWTKRIAIVGGVVGVVVLAVVFISRAQSAKTQKDALGQALLIAEGKSADKIELSPAWRAEVFRATGEFDLSKGKAEKALTSFKKARGQFPRQDGPPPLDQDLMLMRVALAVVDLGGDTKEVADDERLEWDSAAKELRSTLGGIGALDVKALAVREVTAKLLKKQQAGVAVNLVRMLSADEGSPIRAIWVGLAHDPSLPLKEADLKDMREQVKRQVPPPSAAKGALDKVTRLGYAEARAREGKYDEALQIVEARGPGADCVQAALIVADVAEEKGTGERKRFLDTAFQHAERSRDTLSPWLRLQLVRAAVRAGDMERAQELKKALPADAKADFKSWAALEIFRAELAKTQGEADVNLVLNSGTDKDSLPRALAWEALARHNIRISSDIRRSVDTVDDPRVRPFILVGIALGGE